ncbi:MAG: PhoH family protein [Calditrichia bacterium]
MALQKKIVIGIANPTLLYGFRDKNIKLVAEAFDTKIIARGNEVLISGEPDQVEMALSAIDEMQYVIKSSNELKEEDVLKIISLIKVEYENDEESIVSSKERLPKAGSNGHTLLLTEKGSIKPRTEGQQLLVNAIQKNDVVFAIGPAGTGKTFLSVAMAVSALKSKEVLKIILARPAVEAGESLGFLPGDMKEKIEPYLRPLYDALNDMLPRVQLKKYMDQDIIEIIPLAYMRGRTLNNAFIILDEAQNATAMQMKMILTRLGTNSKMVINGDITQVDLQNSDQSGLIKIQDILKGIPGIRFVYLGKDDVVRHKLVKDIIDAFSNFQKENTSD